MPSPLSGERPPPQFRPASSDRAHLAAAGPEVLVASLCEIPFVTTPYSLNCRVGVFLETQLLVSPLSGNLEDKRHKKRTGAQYPGPLLMKLAAAAY